MSDASNTINIRAGLSRNESLLLSTLSEKNKTIFGIKDIVGELNCSYAYAKALANNLAKKRWVIILRRGVYLIVPLSAGAKPQYTEHEFVIASHIVSPYYIAYWSALSFHGLTEQTPFTVFVATTKRVKNREILNVRYRFVCLSESKFFGFVAAAIGPYRVNISDFEKTIADALDHPEHCGGIGEVAKCLWNAREKISLDRIVSYAERMGNRAIVKRLGYLVESLSLSADERILSRMRKSLSAGMSLLDPSMPMKGGYATRWKLMLNVSKEKLDDWRRGF